MLKIRSKKSTRTVFHFPRREKPAEMAQKRTWLLKKLQFLKSEVVYNRTLGNMPRGCVRNHEESMLHRLKIAKVKDFALRREHWGTVFQNRNLVNLIPGIQLTVFSHVGTQRPLHPQLKPLLELPADNGIINVVMFF